MSLDKSNMPLSAKQIYVMNKNSKFDYNHIVQRGLVWERSRKTDLIESMILGYPIPQIFCRRDRDDTAPTKKGNSTYVIMDGKQRLTTIASFIGNEWALSNLDPVSYTTYDGEDVSTDISGKLFEELPEEIQDKIKDTSISLICFDAITASEERELFKRLNAGKPLSAKAKLIANCKDLESILDLGNHSIFTEMLTDNARAQKGQVTIIMKMWAMINIGLAEVSFEGKFFNKLAEETTIEHDDKMVIRDILDYMKTVHRLLTEGDKYHAKIAKKMYTETHFISLVPFVLNAYKNNIDEEMFRDWVYDFFSNEDNSENSEYYLACASGSAKNEKIQIRNDILDASYTKFFAEG